MTVKRKQGADGSPRSMEDDPVVQGVIKAISFKRLRPGAKLGEDQLSKAFGVNRIHVRHVLAYLGSRGIITQYPNRGAYVSEPSLTEARQVFHARRVIERAAIEALIPRLTEAHIHELCDHIEREGAHLSHDRWNTLSLTGDFHALIGRLSGNAVLAKFLDELVLRTSLIIAVYESADSTDCSYEAHPDIAQRLIARDLPGALAAMDAHLNAMESRLPLDAAPEPPPDIASVFAELGVGRAAPRQVVARRRSRAHSSS